jgi:hypothetical protein
MCLVLAGTGLGWAQDAVQHDARALEAALHGLAGSVSAATALLRDVPAPDGLLHPDGCIIWQAPGAALVPHEVWLPGKAQDLSMALNAERLAGLLQRACAYTWGEPPQPREEDYAAGRELPEQVYLLPEDAALRRLAHYYDGYRRYRELSPGPGYPAVPADSLDADCAVIYGSPGGPLEFYFTSDPADGHLVLRHIICYDYFSA